jgi:hypothetical protein
MRLSVGGDRPSSMDHTLNCCGRFDYGKDMLSLWNDLLADGVEYIASGLPFFHKFLVAIISHLQARPTLSLLFTHIDRQHILKEQVKKYLFICCCKMRQ